MKRKIAVVLLASLTCLVKEAKRNSQAAHAASRDTMAVQSAGEKQLTGYGMVVGLAGTGDHQRTEVGRQLLDNVLQSMEAAIPFSAVVVDNVAVVVVTAWAPASARAGTQMDVTVCSVGDASSLWGGTLVPIDLYADGQVYGEARGAVVLDDFAGGERGGREATEHRARGRIPEGGLLKRDIVVEVVEPSRQEKSR